MAPNPPHNDSRIVFYIPSALHNRIRKAAAANGRSVASYGRWQLIQAVEAHETDELERRGGGWLEHPPTSTSNGPAGDGTAAKTTTAAADVNTDRSTGRHDGR